MNGRSARGPALGAIALVVLILVTWGGASAHTAVNALTHQSDTRAPSRADDQAMILLVKAMFRGDVAAFNQAAVHQKGRQEDLDADHERQSKDALVGEPRVLGAPEILANGQIRYHLAADAKAVDGKAVAWSWYFTLDPSTHRVVSIRAYRGQSDTDTPRT